MKNDVHNRLVGLGIPCSIEGEEIHVLGERLVKIRFDDEWLEAFKEYKRARSLAFDPSARTLIHNNSVEVQLTRLSSSYLPASEIYNLSDRGGNALSVGMASMVFSLSFFYSPEYEKLFEVRFKRRLLESVVSTRRLSQLMYTPFTATYTAKGRKTPTNLKEVAFSNIRSGLFKIAVQQHECLAIWKPTKRRLNLNQIGQAAETATIPKAKYGENVVAYYMVAKASPFPSQSFLAYYHVLEYYFLQVSELVLHDRLTALLNAPAFQSNTNSLDKIISLIRGRDSRSDETEMLRSVLDRFVPEEDLISFIEALEDECGEKIYSKKRTVFGEQLQISLTKDHAISNAAKALKHVRNAIVHSSDRYKREECHIPLSDSENIIEEFIPLVRFFAEKVIYGTAE